MVQNHPKQMPATFGSSLSPLSSSSSPNTSISNKNPSSYGLAGLLSLIRVSDPVSSALALGMDLSTLGLDLASTEPLYLNFISPWGNPSARLHQLLPSCYNLNSNHQTSIISRLGAISEEALFFLFYHHCTVGPKPSTSPYFLPICVELCKRGWRWYKETGVWIQPPSAASVAAAAVSKEGPQVSPRMALFLTFDPVRWEKRQFDQSYEGCLPSTSSSSLIDFSAVKSL